MKIDIAAIYARRRRAGAHGGAAPAPAATRPVTPPAPKTFGELASRFWGARKLQTAGREIERPARQGHPATQAANRLPDPADVYARRRRAAA